MPWPPTPTTNPTGAASDNSTPPTTPWPPPPTNPVGDHMALPELDITRVQRWCAARVPEHARHQVRVECDIAARHLTILERRAPWRDDYGPQWSSLPIARLRYTATTNTWILYWRDRNLKFH